MSHIQINFDDVPDQFQQLPGGVYTCTVEKVEQQPTKDGTGQKVVVELKVSEGEFAGRPIFDHIGISKGKPTQLKRLCMAAGVQVGSSGLDLTDLLGKTVQVRTKVATYTDKESGEIKETSRLGDYLVPGETPKK